MFVDMLLNITTSYALMDDGEFNITNFSVISFSFSRRSALQTLYKKSSKAQEQNFFAGGPSHEWVQYYEDRIESDRSCLNEWHAMDSLESRRPPSPDTIRNKFVSDVVFSFFPIPLLLYFIIISRRVGAKRKKYHNTMGN